MREHFVLRGGVLWLSINICSSQDSMVQVVDGEFCPFVGLSLRVAFRQGWRFERLVDFQVF